MPLPTRVPAVVLAAALAVVVGCDPPPPKPDPPPPLVMDEPVEGTLPLQVGDTLPPLKAGGWVNGPPPKPGDPGQKLLVVDVWGMWCPYCASTAPAQVRLHEKYADKGVQFVALTNTMQSGIESYCKQHKVSWPNGFDTPPETIVALGAGSGIKMHGYQVAPIVYLVGPDGKIRWTDERARMQHKGPKGWDKALDNAIAANLDPPPMAP